MKHIVLSLSHRGRRWRQFDMLDGKTSEVLGINLRATCVGGRIFWMFFCEGDDPHMLTSRKAVRGFLDVTEKLMAHGHLELIRMAYRRERGFK